MPCDSLSGFDDAPTMAMVLASVSSAFSWSSGGFACGIRRGYHRVAVLQGTSLAVTTSPELRGHRSDAEPIAQRPLFRRARRSLRCRGAGRAGAGAHGGGGAHARASRGAHASLPRIAPPPRAAGADLHALG